MSKQLFYSLVFIAVLVRQSAIMGDKGLNLFDGRDAGCEHFIVPSWRKGASPKSPTEINKTSTITRVTVLAEQMIRYLKISRKISNEITVSLFMIKLMIVCKD